jgi:hypothetical protein
LEEKKKDKMHAIGLPVLEFRRVMNSYNGAGGDVFPYDTLHRWTRDNYGAIWIPKKGAP